MFLLLNGVMLYSVIKTRFAIKSMPNLFANENLVLVHVLLFTVVTLLWMVERVYSTRNNKAHLAWRDDQTDDNRFAWTLASFDYLFPGLAYITASNLLNLFTLYMCSISSPSSKASSTTQLPERTSQCSPCS